MTTPQHPFVYDLGDQRLNRRADQIVQAALDHPGASIPQAAGSPAAVQGTYDFFDNPRVRTADLQAGHAAVTVQRLAQTAGPILVPQDTTELDFTTGLRLRTLGQLGHAKHCGLFVHSALAITDQGVPVGLLHQYVWERDPAQRGKRRQRRHKETADKESQRWLDTETAAVAALPADRTVITLADREADFYDLFAMPRRPQQHVIIRAKGRRRIAEADHLLDRALRHSPVQGTLTITVPRSDDKPARQATLAVHHGRYSLCPPSTHPRRKLLELLPLYAVLVEEINAPAGVKPLSWLLLTTLPVTCLEDAVQVVRWYCWRWRIERFHYTLKSGCQIEELQLETSARLQRALAVYAAVACQLLYLIYQARQQPEASSGEVLRVEEWQVLWRKFRPGEPLPAQPPSLRQAVRWIAQLGGFLGRKGDGEPGVKVLWRGLRKLQDMVAGYQLAHAQAGADPAGGTGPPLPRTAVRWGRHPPVGEAEIAQRLHSVQSSD
jgi:transposase-like protein/transposase Tn5 family protein